MKRILQLSLILMLFLIYEGQAQEKTIVGTITSSEDGTPLPGVTITAKGNTTIGTVTDGDGKYSLAVPGDVTTLIVSYIGMTTQEVAIGARTTIDVALVPDTKQLSEVVVTAIGIQRKERALGYSLEKIDATKVQQVSEPDPLRALSGKVPGVNIIGSSGLPGSATRITIRGNRSFLGNNQPLFVVDGIPYNNDNNGTSFQLTGGGAYASRIADLDPNNIASMTVLKGGAAAALYGVRAANGVVVITTKTGSNRVSKKGLEISYSTSYSIEKIANLPDYQNKYGTGTGFAYAQSNGSWGPAFPGTVPYPTIDSVSVWNAWNNPTAFPELAGRNVPYRAYPNNVKDFFKTGKVYDNSITITSGGERSTVSATISHMKQDGFVPNSEFTRTNLSLGANTVLENKLRLGGNFAYTRTDQHGPIGGASNASPPSGTLFARTMFLARNWDLHGMPYENPLDKGSVFFVAKNQADNPIWSAKYNGIDSDVDRFVLNLNAGYDLTSWLQASYKIGMNTYSQRDKEILRTGGQAAGGIGEITTNDVSFREINSTFLLTANTNINEDFTLSAFIGHDLNDRTTDQQSIVGTGMIDFNILDIDNTNTQLKNGGDLEKRRLFGILGEVTLGYKDWAFITLNGRNDWSSTMPKNKNSFFYPGISGSLIFTDALGISSDIFTEGKLRAAWSRVGNDADPYSLMPTYAINYGENTTSSTTTLRDSDFPFRGVAGASLSNSELDPNLTPEFTRTIELGTYLSFLKGRASVDLTVYDTRTTDQIARLSLPIVSGFDVFYTNFGEMSNKGIEIGLNLTPVQMSNSLTWNMYGTFTHNKNVVEKLAPGVDEIEVRALFGGSITPVLRPGEEYGIMRGTRSLRDDEGNLLIDYNNGMLISDPNPGIVGNPNPDFIVGLTNTFTYKGVTLSAVFDYRHGGDLYSVTVENMLGRGVTKDSENREMNWVIPGVLGDPNTGAPIRDENGNKIQNNIMIETNDLYFGQTFATNSDDEWSVYDATVIRLREISLGYQLPKTLLNKTPFGSASITLTGRNLWYNAPNFPKHTNFDPETSTFGNENFQGFEFANSPSVRRYGVNLKVTF